MRILLELWPALIPLIIYLLWMSSHRRREVKRGNERPRWVDGPWFWTVLASMGIAIICLIFVGTLNAPKKGNYVPPHMENGKIVEGEIRN